MGFLKTLLIIVLVYYLLKLLARWFAPKLFNYAARRTERHFKEAFGNTNMNAQEQNDEIGDITIDKNTTRKKDASNNVGEYIDFEEIE
jgi:hypothetical protein